MTGTAWDLIAAHERRRAGDQALRKRDGAFYTPPPIAAWLAGKALAPLIAGAAAPADLDRLRILDPAVGAGTFLLAACDALRGAGLAPARAASCCYGYDRDPTAIRVAAAALADHSGGGSPGGLVVADTLLLPPEPRFDVIVGNPPWEKIGRGDPRKPLFDERYAEIREGEINLHGLFLVWALRSLAPGGRLAFLTPNTWLQNRFDARLRRHVLDWRVEEIAILPAGSFADTPVTVPAAIVMVKSPPGGRIAVSAPGFRSEVEQRDWAARPHSAMSVHDDAELARVERCWLETAVPLGDVARASDGIYTSTARAHAFVPAGTPGSRLPVREPGASDRPILLSGAELARDVLLPAGAYLAADLAAKHARQASARVAFHAARHPSLARRLVGAVVPDGVHTSNRFIDVRPDGLDPYFLAAVLLTRALDGYFARRFPVADVDAFMLHQLPV
ncbi:MAG: N-6 DNA methylase, partial [Candidatus Sericytochromatia bacterium]|nr:N-6 DNA methylase [Candidatus Tanganyikabacteria bacterium]